MGFNLWGIHSSHWYYRLHRLPGPGPRRHERMGPCTNPVASIHYRGFDRFSDSDWSRSMGHSCMVFLVSDVSVIHDLDMDSQPASIEHPYPSPRVGLAIGESRV